MPRPSYDPVPSSHTGALLGPYMCHCRLVPSLIGEEMQSSSRADFLETCQRARTCDSTLDGVSRLSSVSSSLRLGDTLQRTAYCNLLTNSRRQLALFGKQTLSSAGRTDTEQCPGVAGREGSSERDTLCMREAPIQKCVSEMDRISIVAEHSLVCIVPKYLYDW
jgi:hypothetical protein